MSRRYSIGFLIFILFIIIIILYAFNNTNPSIDKKSLDSVSYFIKDREGYVTVYQSDGTIYECTSISSSDLPIEIKDALQTGIQIDSITEVYGFLENYSS